MIHAPDVEPQAVLERGSYGHRHSVAAEHLAFGQRTTKRVPAPVEAAQSHHHFALGEVQSRRQADELGKDFS